MRRVASAVMVTLLLVYVLTLTFDIQSGKAEPEVYLLLETDKSVYKLGENVTITLANNSDETIPWTGRFPAPWDIFTYPENKCVFAASPCFCIFELASGENVTYTWNQSDWYTISPVEPGTYEVRDNQAWGLSEYFKIVDAEVVVPDNYPTIQDAINAANEGDTIFVRNGTYDEYLNVTQSLAVLGEDAQCTTAIGFEIYADNVVLSGFTMNAGSDVGVVLSNSSQCNVSNNIVSFAAFYAICLYQYSSNNHIMNNRILSSVAGFGISLMVGCNNNTIRRNSISQQQAAIYILDSHNNTIDGNELTDNEGAAYIDGSFNHIYRNNFVNSGEVADWGENTWDNGCEGNYWSNYNGTDSDNDGVGDTYLPWEGVDNYPLMNPYWNPGDIDHDLDVDIFDVVRCGSAYGSTPSSPNWNPHCDIAEPYGIVDILDIVLVAGNYGESW
ncbi:MAG: right-handed parallel beta-helix repeat-containing protein [Candidatus Bathyarchaeota archaeon]|nr:MAG: right-handed parallel beta-helix repeat-containing protein [Candidatus Bathyarchaeota archaeon]